MASRPSAERTAFSLDVLGRYVCNGLDEALRSADRTARRPDGSPQNDARPFDIIVLGGGTFGAAVASHIFNADQAHHHRVLVLEGGPFLFTEHLQDLPMIGLNIPGATSIAALLSMPIIGTLRRSISSKSFDASSIRPLVSAHSRIA